MKSHAEESVDLTPQSSGMDNSYLHFIFRRMTLTVVGWEEGDEANGAETS